MCVYRIDLSRYIIVYNIKNRRSIMKKIRLILMFSLFALPLISCTKSSNDNPNTEPVIIETDARMIDTVQELTFEESVQRRMDYENLPYEIALEQMTEEEEVILQKIAEKLYFEREPTETKTEAHQTEIETIKNRLDPRTLIQYISLEQSFIYDKNPNFSTLLVADLRLIQDESGTQWIDSVLTLSSKIAHATPSSEWIESQTGADIAPDQKSVYLWIKGNFEVKEDISKADTSSPKGFTQAGSQDSIILYLSDTLKATKTYRVE